MSIAPGTILSMSGAGTDTTDPSKESVSLHGDLSQMGIMSCVLTSAGFDVRNSDVYPVIQGDEIKPALQYLYDNKIDGWWNQKSLFEKYGICDAKN